MPSENDRSDSADARTMRAVAHPVRLDILYLLARESPLTASRCAEILGLTPKVCSYHLNLLGKYGLIEETGEGKGRARPWRLLLRDLTYVHRVDEDRETTSAADQLARTTVARDADIIANFIARRHELPQRWRNVSPMMSSPLKLTVKQLKEFQGELHSLLSRYQGLHEPDAHPVHAAIYAVPVELDDLIE
jgi:DNA-binding transcriptional ArsR family regulator